LDDVIVVCTFKEPMCNLGKAFQWFGEAILKLIIGVSNSCRRKYGTSGKSPEGITTDPEKLISVRR
jgi:hypothetical protein